MIVVTFLNAVATVEVLTARNNNEKLELYILQIKIVLLF